MQLRLGSSRFVIVLEKYVIKVPIFLSWRRFISGTASNYKEYFDWKDSKDSSICRVKFCFGGIMLVADRAEKVSEDEFRNICKKQLKKLLKRMTFKGEFCSHNIGKLNGQYVIIDNGISLNDKGRENILFRRVARKIRNKLGL